MLLLNSSSVNNLGEYQWAPYFIRFLLISWFFVFPWIFLLLFFFYRATNKSKDVVVIFGPVKMFRPYAYVLHNFLFLFLVCSAIFNIFFVLFAFIEIYILNQSLLYEWIWRTKKIKQNGEQNFFFAIVSVGYFFHSCAALPYFYFNLYESDSYFGEQWRSYMKKILRTSSRLRKFRKEYPHIYDFLHPWFFNISSVSKNPDNRKVIVMNDF